MFSRLILSAALLSQSAPALAATVYPGPYAAEVVEVVDGDTLKARVAVWPGVEAAVSVRLSGIDTPELRKGTCREAGAAARDHLAGILGKEVILRQVVVDKYGGRVRAVVTTPAGLDLSAEQLAAGMAREYHGQGKAGWCPGQ